MHDTLESLRTRIAQITGTINRTCGLLGIAGGEDQLAKWCQEREREKRESAQRTLDGAGGRE